jgi:hypothetical protein
MFDAPDGSAQDAAAALGLAASSGGIVGMAEGGKFDLLRKQGYDIPVNISEDTEIFFGQNPGEFYLGPTVKPSRGEPTPRFTESKSIRERFNKAFVEARKAREDTFMFDGERYTTDYPISETDKAAQARAKGMADGGKFPDLSGDGEITQEDILMGRGVIEKAEGGYIGRDQLDKLIKMTVDAILGDAENADEIIEELSDLKKKGIEFFIAVPEIKVL